MARASIETLLPLATWAKLMGISPYEFSQIGEGFPTENTAQCEHVFFQYSWQQDFLSREEIAKCIQMAEDLIAGELGYYPAPKYITGDVRPYPQHYSREVRSRGFDARGNQKALELTWKKVRGGGSLARSLISANVAVTVTDTDGDGVPDRFSLTVPTTVTSVDEIGIYFLEADRNSEPLDETWRIRPINVVISSGNATITGHVSLLVKPDLTLRVNAEILDVTDAIFVTNVDVYRVYLDGSTDTSAQGSAIWETHGCDNPPCVVELAPICLLPRRAELGFVAVNYNVDGSNCSGEPNNVSVNYLAGEPLVNGQMSQTMADIVAHLATALLPVDKCGCERSDRIIAWWRHVPPAQGEGLQQRQNMTGDLSANPFGPQRGAIYAWNKVKRLRQPV